MAVFGGWRLTRTGVVFFVGVLVLAGLVTGGILIAKNHGEAVRRDEAVKVAEKKLEEQSKVEVVAVDKTVKDEVEEAKAKETQKTTTSSATTTTGALPQTGIDDFEALGRIVIVAMLALSVAFYVSSRRAAERL